MKPGADMGTSGSVTVLIGDRNSRVRDFMGREFTAEGCRVLLAGDGWEVFRFLRQESFVDLLVLDPDIPNRYGSGLLARIREERPELPILVHSWRTDEQWNVSARSEDAVGEAPVVLVAKNGSLDRLKVAAFELMDRAPVQGDGS